MLKKESLIIHPGRPHRTHVISEALKWGGGYDNELKCKEPKQNQLMGARRMPPEISPSYNEKKQLDQQEEVSIRLITPSQLKCNHRQKTRSRSSNTSTRSCQFHVEANRFTSRQQNISHSQERGVLANAHSIGNRQNYELHCELH